MSHLKESAVCRFCRDQEREELRSVFWSEPASSGDFGNSTRKEQRFGLVARKTRML